MLYLRITSEEELLLAILERDEKPPTSDEMTVIREFISRGGIVTGHITMSNQRRHDALITVIHENLKFEMEFRCMNFVISRKPIDLNVDHVTVRNATTDKILMEESLLKVLPTAEIYPLWEEFVSPSLVKSYMDDQIDKITKFRYQLLQSR